MQRSKKLVLVIVIIITITTILFEIPGYSAKEFKLDWSEAKKHKDPQWFIDAKFGIYTHWGPITTVNMECPCHWYARKMYIDTGEHTDTRVYKFHIEKIGDPNKIGYKDLIPKFQPKKFDAEKWAKIFKRSGAKFAGPVAIHHDNFAMWDSKVTRWNSKNMGPKIDFTRELEKAIRKEGLRFMTSFHHSWTWVYYEYAYKYDGKTPGFEDLYCEPHEPKAPRTERFLTEWWGKVKEVVDNYQPDLLWYDWGLGGIQEEYKLKMVNYYFNKGKEWGKEVGICYKKESIPTETGFFDFERGRPNKIIEEPWLTDTCPGQWFYNKTYITQKDKIKKAGDIVDMLIDIVSKNGCLLLNIPPDPDGVIPADMEKLLIAMGDWLKINGEAIYGTRHWKKFGEGPTRIKSVGSHSEKHHKFVYQPDDIRFTTKGKNFYAIVMAWPGKEVVVKSLSTKEKDIGEIKKVSLLGHDKPLKWSRNISGLKVQMPDKKPCDFAYTIKVEL